MLHGEPLQSGVLETPTSHHHIWVTGNIFCRWRHSSEWHHTLQNENLSISLGGFCRFPLGTENIRKRQKNAIKDSASKEWFSTPCWAALSSLHGSAVPQQDTWGKAENTYPIKTDHSALPASPFEGRTERTTSMWIGISHVPYGNCKVPGKDLAKRIAQLIQLLYSELKQSEIFGERVLKHLQGRRAMGRTLPSSVLWLF